MFPGAGGMSLGAEWSGVSVIDGLFHRVYIPLVSWPVEYTDEFEEWWNDLTEAEQEKITAKVVLLQERGPILPRPHSDVIVTSRHSNMKELRASTATAELRVLYAFDPRRTAILLIGGDKLGNPSWYEQFVPIADDIFDRHLTQMRKEIREEKDRGKKL